MGTKNTDLKRNEMLLTPDDVAEILQVNKSWIYRAVREDTINYIKLGKYLRFPQNFLKQASQ